MDEQSINNIDIWEAWPQVTTDPGPRRCARFFLRPREDTYGMRPETLLGVALIAAGAILVLLGLAPRLFKETAELHPLIYTHLSLDGLKIGISPLLTIILTILYLILVLRSM
jgi:uncharacterized membrane protein